MKLENNNLVDKNRKACCRLNYTQHSQIDKYLVYINYTPLSTEILPDSSFADDAVAGHAPEHLMSTLFFAELFHTFKSAIFFSVYLYLYITLLSIL